MSEKTVTAAALVIGDEILSGATQDANAPHLARELTAIGVDLVEIRVVSDVHARILAAVRELKGQVDYLFTSGGIGPTHDDITADAVAEACGAPIAVREDAMKILEAYYGPSDLNDARLRMARVPAGATLIDNPISRAPGFRIENVYVMAGVPIIFREMLAGVLPTIEGGSTALSWSFRAPVPEGDLAQALRALDAELPDVAIGVYPFFRGGLGATVVLRARDREKLAAAADAVRALLAARTSELSETPPD